MRNLRLREARQLDQYHTTLKWPTSLPPSRLPDPNNNVTMAWGVKVWPVWGLWGQESPWPGRGISQSRTEVQAGVWLRCLSVKHRWYLPPGGLWALKEWISGTDERLVPTPSLLCSPDVTVLCCPRTGVCQPLPTVGASGNQSCTQQETDRALKPFNQREFAKALIGRDKATIKRLWATEVPAMLRSPFHPQTWRTKEGNRITGV